MRKSDDGASLRGDDSPMLRITAALTLFIAVACAPATLGAPPSQAASPSVAAPTPTPATPSASPLPGTAFTMPTDREMVTFAADRGALVAFSTKEGLPPYDSKVLRASAPSGPWQTVYESDAHFLPGQVVAGRVALGEYRAPYQGGGAYSEDFTVIDLSTGNATAVDRFAMSAATFRGGGGGPRRPVGSVVLGPDRVAWTRLIEGPGGSVTGELRVALLAEPGRVTPIGSSPEWIAALGIDARRLLYVLGGKSEDQLHVRDLDNGVDRIVATGPVGDQQVGGGIPGFNRAFLAGDWAIWLDTPGATAGKVRAVNLASGEERTIGAGGSSCDALSVGTRYVSWYCSANAFVILDTKTLEPTRDAPSAIGAAPMASDDALLWFTVVPGGRTVTLYRPR